MANPHPMKRKFQTLSDEENEEMPFDEKDIEEEENEDIEEEKQRREDEPPERPDLNGYQMFSRYARLRLRKTHPKLHFTTINHHLAKLWRKNETKEKWERKHALKMIDYYYKMADFLAVHPLYEVNQPGKQTDKIDLVSEETTPELISPEKGPVKKKPRTASYGTVSAPATPLASPTFHNPPAPPPSHQQNGGHVAEQHKAKPSPSSSAPPPPSSSKAKSKPSTPVTSHTTATLHAPSPSHQQQPSPQQTASATGTKADASKKFKVPKQKAAEVSKPPETHHAKPREKHAGVQPPIETPPPVQTASEPRKKKKKPAQASQEY